MTTTRTLCARAADANDDGAVDITDPVYVLGFQFLGGPAIPEPYPACGVDPDGESGELGCEVPPASCA